MRKIISVGMATLASILLILIVVFTSIGFVINDETFVNNEFTKLAIGPKMGMTNTDLVTSFNRLVDYMEGTAPDINVTVTIDDCSCGDFGSRIYVEVEAFGLEYHAAYGSMLHEDEEYSDIPDFMWPLIREVGQLTGYRRIPMRDGMPA